LNPTQGCNSPKKLGNKNLLALPRLLASIDGPNFKLRDENGIYWYFLTNEPVYTPEQAFHIILILAVWAY
jgi:hypothetical protein